MITRSTFIQLKAFARQDGAILALVWIASFAAMIYAPNTMLGGLLQFATPFVVYWRLAAFRKSALGGVISFRRAFGYSAYTFFYASLLFAVVQFLYFRFLDNGFMASMFTTAAKDMTPVYQANGMSAQQIADATNTITSLTPIELAFMFMMMNLLIGVILSLLIAVVGMRKTARVHNN